MINVCFQWSTSRTVQFVLERTTQEELCTITQIFSVIVFADINYRPSLFKIKTTQANYSILLLPQFLYLWPFTIFCKNCPDISLSSIRRAQCKHVKHTWISICNKTADTKRVWEHLNSVWIPRSFVYRQAVQELTKKALARALVQAAIP